MEAAGQLTRFGSEGHVCRGLGWRDGTGVRLPPVEPRRKRPEPEGHNCQVDGENRQHFKRDSGRLLSSDHDGVLCREFPAKETPSKKMMVSGGAKGKLAYRMSRIVYRVRHDNGHCRATMELRRVKTPRLFSLVS
jgi:hypothetical protein